MEKFGLIGHPIAHSESPAVFAAAYGGRWPYDLIEGEDFELSWKRFLDEYRAINITAPFKELAFRKLLECGVVDESVRSIGAINIAVKEADGLVHGYNSDYLGVRLLLEERGFGEGKTVLVVGFGGAGKAAAAAARSLGCDVVICNRSRHTPDIRPLEELPLLAPVADLLIYTLSLPVPQLADLCPGPGSLPAHKRSGTFPAETAAPLGCTACACDQTDCADAGPAILEANYHTPCLANHPHYISGRLWHRAQAITGYPLMTGLPVQHEPQL